MSVPENGWGQYQRLVLDKLDRLERGQVAIDHRITEMQAKEIGELRVEVAMLKVKSGLWGAAAGLVPAAILVIVQLAGGP